MLFLSAVAFTPDRESLPTILLVEDHPDTRQMYAEFLEDTFQVLDAPDAERALSLLRSQRVHLVITDLSLPGMNGFDMIEQMRREPATRGIPVICLSGFGGEPYESRARALGCDLVLEKPCLPDDLASAAVKVLRDREGEARR